MQENNLTFQNTNVVQIEPKTEDYTLVEIDSKVYAIKTVDVLEIIKIVELDYPNKMLSCILGVIKYDEKPVGVIDLREVFKKNRVVYDLSSKIIIIKAENLIISIVCDKVLDIVKLQEDKIHEFPYSDSTNFYDGVYINNEESIYILNPLNITNYIKTHQNEYQNDLSNERYIVNDEKSIEILKDRKNFLIKDKSDIQVDTPLYDMGVSFIINDIKYYINMASVKEFYKVTSSKFIKVPNTPDFILGLVNIKGEYITVLDIRRFYNTTPSEVKEKSTIIILNSDEFKIGVLADEICESMNINFDEIVQNKLQKEETDMIEFVKDGEIYQVLDIEKLFKDDRLTIA